MNAAFAETVREGLDAVLSALKSIEGEEHWLFFLAISFVLTLFFGKRTGRTAFFWPGLFCIIFLLNPLVFPGLMELVPSFGSESYRLFWLIPMTLIMAFGPSAFLGRLSGHTVLKGAFGGILAVFLLLAFYPSFGKLRNAFSIPSGIQMADGEVMAVCGYFQDEAGKDEPLVAFEEKTLEESVREYDPAILISTVFSDGASSGSGAFEKEVREQQPDYIVINKESAYSEEMKDLGYQNAAYTENHLIYVHLAE